MDELERQVTEVHRVWRDFGPPPVQQPRIGLIMGGAAKPRGARLAARFADEYNVVSETAAACAERRAAIVAACEAVGRDPSSMTFSLMTGFVIGADDREVRRRAAELADWTGQSTDEVLSARDRGSLVGTPAQIRDQLAELERAGVERVMLQHLLHWDVDALALIASELL
jgi:alkanesulfonate monooxygenase SsuD/methylene tetrahydromethanopterin reductase-like flavin-dependent oxidoreductase (luciferase family)